MEAWDLGTVEAKFVFLEKPFSTGTNMYLVVAMELRIE